MLVSVNRVGAFACTFGLLTVLATESSFAETVVIDFEDGDSLEAVNLYTQRGVRFPSRPTVRPVLGGHILTQGFLSAGPRELPIECDPLVMEFAASMDVRVVRMRVINSHRASYAVKAFSGDLELDRDTFSSRPLDDRRPSGITERSIELRASMAIRRVVVEPPAGCIDIASIDDLVLETEGPVVPIPRVSDENRVYVLAYEVTQGVMSRLSRSEYRPDTRLMALPDKRIRFVEGRDTVVRFFLAATVRRVTNQNARLDVTIRYRNSTVLRESITENTSGGRAVPSFPPDTTEERVRRQLVKIRARTDLSLDYVVPGTALRDALWMELELRGISDNRLYKRIRVDFIGPLRFGMTINRIRGVGTSAWLGAAPTVDQVTQIAGLIEDRHPITGPVQVRMPVVTAVGNCPRTNCGALLTCLIANGTLTAASGSIIGVNAWTNLYLVTASPPDCVGIGVYGLPDAFSVPNPDSVGHELGHNIGINHATNLHGEGAGGATDWEPWPYLHGSIGPVDEDQPAHLDGVFGMVAVPAEGDSSSGSVGEWGRWDIYPIAPCNSIDDDELFPQCSVVDADLTHDLMTYGPAREIEPWGSVTWISDVNYYRAQEWLESCQKLDPPHAFLTANPVPTALDTTGNCTGVAGLRAAAAGVGAASSSSSSSMLVVAGRINDAGQIDSFHLVRKLAVAPEPPTGPGPWRLALLASDGRELAGAAFTPARVSQGTDGVFAVAVPMQPDLARLEIRQGDAVRFGRDVEGPIPRITLVQPAPGDVWRTGQARVEWSVEAGGEPASVYVAYSDDDGQSWWPLAYVDAEQTYLDVDVSDLPPSDRARLYVSVTRGLSTAAALLSGPMAVGANATTPRASTPPARSSRCDCLQTRPNGPPWGQLAVLCALVFALLLARPKVTCGRADHRADF